MIQRTLFLILLFNVLLHAYQDNDVDGVDDRIDRCLNTSFDDIVDESGCPHNMNKQTKLILEIGTELAYDQEDTKTNAFNFYLSYQYANWFATLSNSSYNISDSSYDDLSLGGDYYAMLGYIHRVNILSIQYALGVKIPNQNSDISSGEFDYFGFVTLNYPISTKQSLYASYGYTIKNDSNTQTYNNYHSLALGGQYQINDKWQVGLGYKYNGASYEEGDDYRTLSLNGCYKLSKNFYVKANYEKGLNDQAYKNAFSLSIGVTFE